MNLRSKRRGILRLICLTLFAPIFAFSQSPGGVSGQKFWYSETDSTDLISNYHSIDLLNMGQEAGDSILSIPVSSSLFVVLKGNFAIPMEDTLLQIGDVTLVDLGMYHGRGFTSIDFTDSTSKIISVQTIRGHRLAKDTAPEINIGDLSKFSVAEVIYYPYALDRAQRRMVNSYLSIKYAIPILTGIEPDWKDYWAKDSTHYWDANKDKSFYVRVMGLGADKAQDFYQTQSIAETGNWFKLSLDTTAAAGTMPRTWVAEEGFVIFAERKGRPNHSFGYCGNVRTGKNPLVRWKFKATDNWRTNASRILVDIKKPNGTIADSIFYTDGTNYFHAPWVYQDAKIIRYAVDLSNVHTGRNYLFTKRSSAYQNCNSISVTSDQAGISVTSDGGMLGSLMVHSFETGVTYEGLLDNHAFVPIGAGQYHVVVTDEMGMDVFNELVAISGQTEPTDPHVFPSLRMYPNPVLTSESVTVELSGFSSADKTWQLTDALGRVLIEQPVDSAAETVTFMAPKAEGSYTFSVLTQDGVYSLKLIVAQR